MCKKDKYNLFCWYVGFFCNVDLVFVISYGFFGENIEFLMFFSELFEIFFVNLIVFWVDNIKFMIGSNDN